MTVDSRARMHSGAASSARAGLLAGHPWAAVLLLMLVIVVNYLDRFLPAILAEPIKRDLGLSDTFLGVLNGLGFLAVYAVAGVPIARLADNGRHGVVISTSLAVWSVMTALGGFAATGWQLALARTGVAVAEAGSTPASHAYVSASFPPGQRTKALAVLTLGTPLGVMASLTAGGVAGELLGWRNTFLVMGAVSLCLAPLVLAALGPGRPFTPAAAEKAAVGLFPALLKPTIIAVLGAVAFISMGGYAATAFSPAFLIRIHGMSVGAVGLRLGLLNGIIGTLAVLAMGLLAARLSRRDPRWTLWLLAGTVFVCAPCGALAFLVHDRFTALVLLGLTTMITNGYLALTVACLHGLVPAAMRARTSAVMLFCSALFGGLGPLLAGMISDVLAPTLGPAALARAMLIVPATFALAGLCYIVATTTYRSDLIEEPPHARDPRSR